MTQNLIPDVYQIGMLKTDKPASSPGEKQRPLFWRSLIELDAHACAEEEPGPEFSPESAPGLELASRRDFLRLMSASLALSGAFGCAVQPLESIVPYVEQPEWVTPGKPLFFATAVPTQGFATGVLVKSQTGRPIKIEGNPAHPASLGATDVFAQAEILSLYDPDRAQVVLSQGRVSTWERFLDMSITIRKQKLQTRGRGLRILTPTITSPTLADQLQRLLRQFPEAKWHSYEPVFRDHVREGVRLAFGEDLEPQYHFDKADIVLALDADFLDWGPDHLRHVRDFTSRRTAAKGPDGAELKMNRLYAVECTPSLTGAAADHRLAVMARDVSLVARKVARALKFEGVTGDNDSRIAQHESWIAALVHDLERQRQRSLVVAGASQPAFVHVLAHALNDALGNIGKTITFHQSPVRGPMAQMSSLSELATDLHKGLVDTLLILGANPIYEAPADLGFAAALRNEKVTLAIHLGLYEDETAEFCHWHIPQAHFLESWSDLRALDGTVTIQQPLIAPLYRGRSAHEVLAALLGESTRSPLETLRDYWRGQSLPGDFDAVWRRALLAGVLRGSASNARSVSLKRDAVTTVAETKAPDDRSGLEIVFRPDPTVWDGRYANNGWLQELPKPLTRLTWDNPALVSPAQARKLGLSDGDVVVLRSDGRDLRLPVCIAPGQADDSVTVFLGHGRWRAGRIGNGVGVNANALRTSESPWFKSGLEIAKTPERHPLAAVQHHHVMAGRDLVRVAAVEEFPQGRELGQDTSPAHAPDLSLYSDRPRGQNAENAWGMAIDLSRCIGCGACVVACQAENNIPIVGKEEVLRSREMHWLRIDRYYEGEDAANPKTYFQPVPCMHCEKAPCELVCPVGATTHSDEGLNEMTYNRCVGTRYCSNNCPYKVRRFNFFPYSDEATESLKLMRNPDVTVRPRGVMEKCTYCVQRINVARINAKMEERPLGGDEVVTACQAVCPAHAIVFGNLVDPHSAVARAKNSPRNYALLEELNTHPRTTYLTALRNPNRELETIGTQQSEGNDGRSRT
jgi:molybdopterin-containing oxidoreductase family iron-sulfur binding subunit